MGTTLSLKVGIRTFRLIWLSIYLYLFRFMATFTSCSMMRKAHYVTLPKCQVNIQVLGPLGPLFWECPHHRALPYTPTFLAYLILTYYTYLRLLHTKVQFTPSRCTLTNTHLTCIHANNIIIILILTYDHYFDLTSIYTCCYEPIVIEHQLLLFTKFINNSRLL